MTLEEVERLLPNGLHDAILLGVRVDYVCQTAVVDLDIDVSSVRSAEQAYRLGRLTFAGVQFVAIDPPDIGATHVGVPPIDTGMGQPATASHPLPVLPADCFLCWLFVVRWNGFVRIAARSVSHEWINSTNTAAPAARMMLGIENASKRRGHEPSGRRRHEPG